MKFKHLLGLLLLGMSVWACGSSGPSEEDLAAEAEADRLDSLNQVMEATTDAIEEDAAALEAALDSLDVLFPEEE